MNKEKLFTIIKFIVLVGFIVVLPLVLYLTNKEFIQSLGSLENIENFVESSEKAPLVFFGLQILQVVIAFIPGEIYQLAAGYLFGIWKGLLITVLGCIVGSTICFGLSRYLGQGFIRTFFSDGKLDSFTSYMNSSKGLLICFLLFLIPGIQKDLLTYAAGASEMKFVPFMVVATVGRIPAMIGSMVMGTLADARNYTMVIVLLIIAVTILVAFLIFRKRIMNYLDSKKAE